MEIGEHRKMFKNGQENRFRKFSVAKRKIQTKTRYYDIAMLYTEQLFVCVNALFVENVKMIAQLAGTHTEHDQTNDYEPEDLTLRHKEKEILVKLVTNRKKMERK